MSSAMHFDTEFSLEKSVHVIKKLCALLPNALPEVLALVEASDWKGLISYEMSYPEGLRFETARDTRQVLAFFQKNSMFDIGISTEKVAFDKFLSCEVKNLSTNRLFRDRSNQRLDAALIFIVQRKIAAILGDCPCVTELNCGFGPGASVGVSRLTSLRRKLSTSPTVTTDASKFLEELREELPLWHWLDKPTICDFGKLTFVPKNAKTDRPIVVEPLVNTFLQKGVGAYIRERLRRAGCDLNDQGRNQELAREGSASGTYATLDLASASDTISREVVAELLPYDWWYLLDSIRTPVVKLPDGRLLYQQKFSSMGNGFTFELESLIFYAIALAVCDTRDVSVYGDDIIVPTEFADRMLGALSMFGFEVNTSKSYWTGSFRESCGRDFLGGIDIRPVYLKGRLSVKELFRLHNFFHRNFAFELRDVLVQYIPKRFRVYGPDGFGDGHLLGDGLLPFGRKRGFSGWVFRTFVSKPLVRREMLSGDYAAILWKAAESSYEPPIRWQPAGHRLPPRYRDVVHGDLHDAFPTDTLYQERGNEGYQLKRVYTLSNA